MQPRYSMDRRGFAKIVGLLWLAVWATPVQAQLTVDQIAPRSAQPGQTTRLQLSGQGFTAGMQLLFSQPAAEATIVEVAGEKLVLDLTLPAEVPLGPMGLWCVTAAGPSEPQLIIIDDLPVVAASGTNSSPETAQVVEPLVAIEGASPAAQSAFYRLEVAAGQRVAFEVLTQPLGSSMDPVLRLLDAQQQTLVLADDDQRGPDCRFEYRFEQAGTYWLELRDNRYAAGGLYRLRIGDFPIITGLTPLVVPAGQSQPLRFTVAGRPVDLDDAAAGGVAAGEGDGQAETVIVQTSTVAAAGQGQLTAGGSVTTAAVRLPGGRSSAWHPLLLTSLPVAGAPDGASDDETVDRRQPIQLGGPSMVTGTLVQEQAIERWPIQGIDGLAVRFQAYGASIGCPTLLRMRLLDDSGQQVAEAAVANSDEWSVDYVFPDDRIYQLELTDLLGRGGAEFGYAVKIRPAGSFRLIAKPEAGVPQQFAVESGHGIAAIDLQVQRFGYAGPIELSLDGAAAGLRLLQTTIEADATEHRVYVQAGDGWSADSACFLRLQGVAVDGSQPAGAAVAVSHLPWQRIKTPHVPFPIHWREGVYVLGGVTASEPLVALEPAGPLRLARPLPRHELTLTLRRLQEAFKGGVTLLADPQSAHGWPHEIKQDGDTYTVAWTRPAAFGTAADDQPAQFQLMAISDHQGRSRATPVVLPVQWFDPLRVSLQLAVPLAASGLPQPLVVGTTVSVTVRVSRDGDDPQPVTVRFPGAAAIGLAVPEAIEIAADQSQATFAMQVLPAAGESQQVRLEVVAESSYRGQSLQVAAEAPAWEVIPAATQWEIYPSEVTLTDAAQRRQIIVTGMADGQKTRDWTSDVVITSQDPTVAVVHGSVVHAVGDGQTSLVIQAGDQRQEIAVNVTGTQTPRRIAFENEVMVALSKQGCNAGACHGSPSGKGMFRLSLRAFDRELDERTLLREDYGRRLNPIEPEESLLLLKPLMRVSHGGGRQLNEEDEAYRILRDWIAQGARPDPADAPRCVRLEVTPGDNQVLPLQGGVQQLAAVAHFSDGTQRDATHLVAYESSDTSVATVDSHGLVTPLKRGETVILVRFLEHIESVPLMFIQQIDDFQWEAPEPANYVDELVNAKLHQLQFVPSPTADDSEFLRRVYLDLLGILPTIDETRQFLADRSDDKRQRLIDQLLERDEFAKFWALKWGDWLKMTSQSVGDGGVYKYHRWVQESFRNNVPYDQFARDLLTASGSTLANPAANFYRTAADMNECVENVSQVFLGARLQCAKCHNHPFERWTQDNYYGLGAFFNRVQRRSTQRPGEMFIWHAAAGEVTQPRTGATMAPWVPVAGNLDVADDQDRRLEFADWLIAADNPYFARMEVNRIWAQLFARGIVDPIDDFRDSNPPTNPALLDELAADFAANGFDRRQILRVILNSRTYQASHRSTPLNRDDTLYFSHQRPRLLSAEQLLDALQAATGVGDSYGHLPPGTRATQLPAPDVVKVDFLRIFGQPERNTVCACERTDDSNLAMAIELFNGATIHRKLQDPQARFRADLAAGKPLEQVIEELYLAMLCRPPSEQELAAASEHCSTTDDPAAGVEDLCWALLNSDAFLFQQ